MATYLRLTDDEFNELNIEISENNASGDGLYNYYFYVPDNVPDDLLKRLDWSCGDLIDNIA